MSYYTGLASEKNLLITNRRLAAIVHRGNREDFKAYVNKRRATDHVKSSTHTSDADEFKRFFPGCAVSW